jgi:hypothetical protein
MHVAFDKVSKPCAGLVDRLIAFNATKKQRYLIINSSMRCVRDRVAWNYIYSRSTATSIASKHLTQSCPLKDDNVDQRVSGGRVLMTRREKGAKTDFNINDLRNSQGFVP